MELRRELGLRDLILFGVSCIIGTRWISAAAHAGPGSISLWLIAGVVFVIPLAIAVASLTAKYPGAGGLYLWTRGDFGRGHAFIAFWLYWMGIAFWFPSATIFYMSAALDAFGLGSSRPLLLTVALAAIWIALGTNLIGLSVGKWTENLGAACSWILGLLLLVVAALVFAHRGAATHLDPIPRWNWETVSFWSAIAYALSGLELVGFMGAEVKDPKRNLPRAGVFISLSTTVFYAATTIALLVILPPGRISEISGVADGAREAGMLLRAPWLTPVLALLVAASGMGQLGGIGTSVSRLPFAAGVDGLLPAAFSRVHPRWSTPYVSIVVLGCVASFLLIASQIGDTLRAAYQSLISLMVIAGFFPYLYIFAGSWKAGNRVSGAAGCLVTLLAMACAVFPTAEVNNIWLFEAKILVGTGAVVASGWILYKRHEAAPQHIIRGS